MKKGYSYVLPITRINALKMELKTMERELEDGDKVQHFMGDVKRLAFGDHSCVTASYLAVLDGYTSEHFPGETVYDTFDVLKKS